MAFPNQGAHLKGHKVRSTHLGFDCYVYGPIDQRKVRCLLRRHRMPNHIAGDLRNQVPTEVCWPTGSHEEAHRCIEAIYRIELPTLRAYRRQYPDHAFGFEPFITWAERWHAANPAAPSHPSIHGHKPKAVPADSFGTWVKHAEALRETTLGPFSLRQSVVWFADADPALRVDVYPCGEGPSRFNRLARLYLDLVDGRRQKVVEWLPGRFLGLGINPLAAQRLLGLGRDPIPRRTVWDEPAVQASRRRAAARLEANRGEAMRAREAVQASATLAESADPDVFAPHLVPPGVAR